MWYATKPPLHRKDSSSNDAICNKASNSVYFDGLGWRDEFGDERDMQQDLCFCRKDKFVNQRDMQQSLTSSIRREFVEYAICNKTSKKGFLQPWENVAIFPFAMFQCNGNILNRLRGRSFRV
jgi:hypothetical protein